MSEQVKMTKEDFVKALVRHKEAKAKADRDSVAYTMYSYGRAMRRNKK
jgi:hypothetical protein